jgi:hypothetical protein
MFPASPTRGWQVIAACLLVTAASSVIGVGLDGVSSAQASVYVGNSFNDRLLPDRWIGNYDTGVSYRYRLIMQLDGNLVLYSFLIDPLSTPTVCWASNTANLHGAYAKFHDAFLRPFLTLESPYGRLRTWTGTSSGHYGNNVSISLFGELRIGARKIASC